MSRWGSLSATLVHAHGLASVEDVQRTVPKGSEGGPSVLLSEDGNTITVDGRLRDVSDEADSFAVLAWFTATAEYCTKATLTWDVDDGPRYRYEMHDGRLVKLRGVLDL